MHLAKIITQTPIDRDTDKMPHDKTQRFSTSNRGTAAEYEEYQDE